MAKLSRRGFLQATGLAALARGANASAEMARPAADKPRSYGFFNPQEAAFIEAAVARLIPADNLGPGALEADVPGFIDKQLGGAWGAGERLYRSGPWHAGTPSQGYQLPFTPAELFRNALRAIDADLAKSKGHGFANLPPAEQDAYLTALEKGERDLGSVPAKVFFETLWEMTLEGYFSDPVYGGNKNMAAWEMIGFPGAYANFYELVDRHGEAFQRRPVSLGETGTMQIHPDPNIPAYAPAKGR
ncbi:MAG TPA: gluconate 2-dehydrogenase subunit 3 family protein [Rhodocyclaceae bacterium]|nr:gluconate 2-dehydrogenase subunit 3 family protein [Rhodocyclaceae bacterium]